VAATLSAAGARLRPATLVDDPEWVSAGPFTVYLGGGIRHDMMPYVSQRHPAIKTVDDLIAYNSKDPATRSPFGNEMLVSLATGAKDLGEADFRALGTRLSRAAANTLDAAFRASGSEVLVSFENIHSTYYATAGYPAVTVPAGQRHRGGTAGQLGLASDGMPAGVTFIGKPGQDAQLLAYAYAFEQASNLRVAPTLR